MYLTSPSLTQSLCGLQCHAVKNNVIIIKFINAILHLHKYMYRKSVKKLVDQNVCVFVILIDVVYHLYI